MSNSHRSFRRTLNNVSVEKSSSHTNAGLFSECDENHSSFSEVKCRLPAINTRTSYNRTRFSRDLLRPKLVFVCIYMFI